MIPYEHQWQSLGREELQRRQLKVLRNYLLHTVLPFSAHYQKLFKARGIDAASIHSMEDLAKIPFTTKVDLLSTPEEPDKMRDFLLIPDPKVLMRNPSVIAPALLFGRSAAMRK